MAWNGWKVIDMDSHIVERPEEMYDDYIDPSYREKLERLKRALQENIQKGFRGSIASSRYAVLAPIVSDNALGDHDTFGMVPREIILHPTDNRPNFGRPDRPDLPITRRREASSDVKVRLGHGRTPRRRRVTSADQRSSSSLRQSMRTDSA